MKNLYFDYCASAPSYPEVNQLVFDISSTIFGNPSSNHEHGYQAKQLVDRSRKIVSSILNVEESEVIFTSGATESNNLAIHGVLNVLMINNVEQKPLHVIISDIEHSSVYNCLQLLENKNLEVSYLPVDSNGIVSVSSVKEAIKDNTVLISIMHVNNETGAIQPIEEIGELLKMYKDIVFHVDGVQGFGKVKLDLTNVGMYTLSGHKIGGPKGTGVLVAKNNIEIAPLLHGGGQEFGVRPGTVNVPGVVGLAEAIKITDMAKEASIKKIILLNAFLYTELKNIPEIVLNSPPYPLSSPHIINFSYPGVTSAFILNYLSKRGIMASSQSACSSQENKASRVLMSITKDESIASSGVRVSLHETVDLEDIEYLVRSISDMICDLSGMRIG
ncbi:cysteine desulfurase family protein [Fontibacillus sp. BL9]|uniref:cysteine desulfurase family protein n=1 Tax=Fontibacillus sp. BL9 TaxID=3389971 RepID=UPI003978C499